MAWILHIETATDVCSVCLGKDGQLMAIRENHIANSHSELITVFIQELLQEAAIKAGELQAIALSIGPGSYTGLRIGASVAKGMCYASDTPLISVSTLQTMSYGIYGIGQNAEEAMLYCPMIDARRMEVYAALYDHRHQEVAPPEPEVITGQSFSSHLQKNKVLFFGNGAAKCREILGNHPNANFPEDFQMSAKNMLPVAYEKFKEGKFENTTYFEPFYLKNFKSS